MVCLSPDTRGSTATCRRRRQQRSTGSGDGGRGGEEDYSRQPLQIPRRDVPISVGRVRNFRKERSQSVPIDNVIIRICICICICICIVVFIVILLLLLGCRNPRCRNCRRNRRLGRADVPERIDRILQFRVGEGRSVPCPTRHALGALGHDPGCIVPRDDNVIVQVGQRGGRHPSKRGGAVGGSDFTGRHGTIIIW